ncbi:UDP-N-acetyl-D-mannosamine dehydrogenase [Bdellovibrio svalbardensis]|uniref:UDP-N-acetyl-D-mannosamine dehydrogenase n=1 Tax=Bdellovibrio svalbardensis TaxID=2972972 RepID=A0ABT6DKF8_9BACT|nr:UDP-N-acetyl-D-mannosamine dehydrogenase [Bdellovibrio svalbardensis]MDG0817357.1 UDP-N-acetyl-D-mannosamine dehydrogenase [Bdellovibrio svalbardensis]
MKKKICIVGLGYIGLPTAALLANRGYNVFGVDIVQEVVDIINQGRIHIVEPELDTFVRAAVNSGNLKAATLPTEADIFILAVPTPFHPSLAENEAPKPNLDYVFASARSIVPYLKPGCLVVLESTSPVGTTDMISKMYAEMGVDISQIHLAHCPERVLPGHIMKELVENDRIVGGVRPESTHLVAEFYRTFVTGEVLETNARTAEMAKLTENSYRDVNIAFANELSVLCDKFEINVWELIGLANRHPRVNILNPGCGVGGHCIAVDPWFIVDAGAGAAKLIETARRQNDFKSEWVIEKVKNAAMSFEMKNGRKPKIACMGLAFKPDIDDLRESPALYITTTLLREGLQVFGVEPNIGKHIRIELMDYQTAANSCDLLVFLVGHKEFKTLEVQRSQVLDFCGIFREGLK